MIRDINELGFVMSDFSFPTDQFVMKKHVSWIIIHEEFTDALEKIEENDYLQIIYKFHLIKDYVIKDASYNGIERGIFASRCSRRPNGIGLSTVKLIEKKGTVLKVIGLDALNGSPILDIKPYCGKADLICLETPLKN